MVQVMKSAADRGAVDWELWFGWDWKSAATGKPLHSAVAVSATTQKESELALTNVLDFSDSGQACAACSTRLL